MLNSIQSIPLVKHFAAGLALLVCIGCDPELPEDVAVSEGDIVRVSSDFAASLRISGDESEVVGPVPFVRGVYLIGSDETPVQDWRPKLQTTMAMIQFFYVSAMFDHGYAMTFLQGRDASGLPDVDLVQTPQPLSVYGCGTNAVECYAHIAVHLANIGYDFDRTVLGVVGSRLGALGGSLGTSGRGGLGISPAFFEVAGRTWNEQKAIFCDNSPAPPSEYPGITTGQLASLRIGGLAHELGHSFLAPHVDNGSALMSTGFWGFGDRFVNDCVPGSPTTIDSRNALLFSQRRFFDRELPYDPTPPVSFANLLTPLVHPDEPVELQVLSIENETPLALHYSQVPELAWESPHFYEVFEFPGAPKTVEVYKHTIQPPAGGFQLKKRKMSITIGAINQGGLIATAPARTVRVIPYRAELAIGLGTFPTNGGWVELLDAHDKDAASVWKQTGSSEYRSQDGQTRPVLCDLDNDDRHELVIGFGPFAEEGGKLVVRDDSETGYAVIQELTVPWSQYNEANGETFPACGDIDGDGRDEIVVGLGKYTAAGGWIYIFDDAIGNYAEIEWKQTGWTQYNDADGSTYPAVGDVDGDGKAEIVIGFASYPASGGWIHVIDDAGNNFTHLAWRRPATSTYNGQNGELRPATCDLDDDGRDEIVVGGGPEAAGRLWIINDANSGYAPLATKTVDWPAYNTLNGETFPACGDTDLDGREELVIGLGAGGQGFVEIKDDLGSGLGNLDWIQLHWDAYNDAPRTETTQPGLTRPSLAR